MGTGHGTGTGNGVRDFGIGSRHWVNDWMDEKDTLDTTTTPSWKETLYVYHMAQTHHCIFEALRL